MSEKSDGAFAAARAEIARVKASGEERLDLGVFSPRSRAAAMHYSGRVIQRGLDRALDRLPAEILELTSVEALILNGTRITDLSPIAGMTGLAVLDLRGTAVSDLTPLARMVGITTLDLRHSQVNDLIPLAGMAGLADVDARGLGVLFSDTPATRDNPRLAEIAAIKGRAERGQALLDYLAEEIRQRTEKALEDALRGPILAEALADIARHEGRFRAVALEQGPERPANLRHQELLATLRFAAGRFGRVETQNRIGRDLAANFADYAEATAQEPLNPRILSLLAMGIRGALTDPHLAEALDGFDRASLSGFLREHDAFIGEYYPRALIGPRHQVTTDLAKLEKEFFPKLASAREILRQADEAGLLAPNVSSALEMAQRDADGARRKLATAADPALRAAAEAQLRRDAVIATGYLGRVTARVKLWLAIEAEELGKRPLLTGVLIHELYQAGRALVQALTPIFDDLESVRIKLKHSLHSEGNFGTLLV